LVKDPHGKYTFFHKDRSYELSEEQVEIIRGRYQRSSNLSATLINHFFIVIGLLSVGIKNYLHGMIIWPVIIAVYFLISKYPILSLHLFDSKEFLTEFNKTSDSQNRLQFLRRYADNLSKGYCISNFMFSIALFTSFMAFISYAYYIFAPEQYLVLLICAILGSHFVFEAGYMVFHRIRLPIGQLAGTLILLAVIFSQFSFMTWRARLIPRFLMRPKPHPVADAHDKRGIQYRTQGEYMSSIEEFNAALELDKANADVYYNHRGNTYLAMKEYKKAEEDHTKAIRLNPQAKYFHNRSLDRYNRNRISKCMGDCGSALRHDPKYHEARYTLVRCYNRQRKYEKALKHANMLIDQAPEKSDHYVIRGIAYQGLKRYKKAYADYQRSIEIDPDFYYGYYNLMLYYLNKKDYNKAIEYGNTALTKNPDGKNVYGYLGKSYFITRKYGKAIINLKKAIELDRLNADYHHSLGVALLSDNKIDEAIESLITSLKLEPEYKEHRWAHFNLGECYAKKGLYDLSIKEYTKELKHRKHFVIYGKRAMAYIRIGKFKKALKDYQAALKIRTRNEKEMVITSVSKALVSAVEYFDPDKYPELNKLNAADKTHKESAFEKADHSALRNEISLFLESQWESESELSTE